jgi:Uncharacterized protein conserved in bacteria
MNEPMEFPNRATFREWLEDNGTSCDGVWLIFGKKDGPTTITYPEALEEALCFGWIDGHVKSLDDMKYKRRFTPRRANSNWSEKNRGLVKELEEKGMMTDHGRKKIEEAKKNGQWALSSAYSIITDDQIAVLSEMLRAYEPAHTNFQSMSPSVRKTYARAYFDAKTETGKNNRLAWMIDRLNRNLKPM